ncbi:MAG: amidohydrolase family protein [Saprospiraceae bacterium]|nr:amidohydrolase family protein [Saprospiraceae bacterium]MCF8251654.1 amidohydrolase family protein [Saprospiraceae bacterium]MCF8281064.1 amidohydrolase family protein [Bacteroidales bacterium]MCF8313273.1 amidohydrolase family protein [Saprospiraceae bacterium]MCF8442017.1 amidohydrolase family protein [Saprospiraceae bacterium]
MKLNLTLIALLATLSLFAQKKKTSKKSAPKPTTEKKADAPKWDVNNPPGPWGWKDVKFNTTEGTWLNLDLSPDGKTIVFDMLGDIYTMPIAGGKATPLRSGIAWEVQPRFSPDGKRILFTSDAGGGDNIWLMNIDGKDAKQVTKEDFRLLNNATWMPDGQYFIARKHFTSGRSLGAGEMWMYHVTGGEGLQLTERKNDQQDVNEPSVSPDGRYVYFSEDQYPGGSFQYNKDPNSQIYGIRRYDRQEGKIEDVVTGPGGACRPQISNDGTKLAFIRRVRTQSVLWVAELKTGQEYPLFDQLSKDQQEAWAIFGAYPGFDWMPTDNEIVIYGMGKLWRVPVMLGAEKPAKAVEIPFSVDVDMKVAETVRPKQKAFEDNMEVKVMRGAVTSPDGKWMVYNAAGKLWVTNIPFISPQDESYLERLIRTRFLKTGPNSSESEKLKEKIADQYFQFEPSFSPDGKSIVFVTWDDEDMGAIFIQDDSISGGAVYQKIRRLTKSPGIYRTPAYSPDGKQIVFVKEDGNSHQGFTHCKEPGIYLMPADGSVEPKLVTPQGEYPQFSADGKRIFYQKGGYLFGSLVKSVESVDLNGEDKKEHFDGKYSHRYVISPDNQWVAWSELFKVYVAPFPKTGKKVGLTSGTKAVPVAQVARDAGINIHWSADSKTLHWTLGNEYFSDELTERFKFLEGSRDSLPPMDSVGVKIKLTLPADKPQGLVAFTNARIITMEGDEVIERGTVVVEGNVIKSVGANVSVPNGAKVIDCAGKTIMPGMVDAHAHSGNFRYGLSPQKQWEYYANLAYGVTTSHDPSANTEMVFAQSELIKAGYMVGPRLFSTGTILYGADGDFKAVINSLDDAKSALRRTKAFGAFSVKSYNQPRREQRQQVIAAARELGIQVVPEGGSTFYHNLSEVVDGHTTVEHNIPIAPLYKDVTTLWAATKTHNTPTLIVNYGSVSGEYYWYQHTNVWEKERLLSFTPRGVVDSRARHRTMIPEEEYVNGHILTSQSLKKLQDAGVKINLGAHGQLQGLGAHWELWMLQQGGMSNLEALKCATINGAASLGMDEQIGSIKAGKLADLIVLDKNPLENIQNSEFVKYTMVNGRLYDSATMNEIGNYDRKRTRFYFELPGSGNGFPYFKETNSFMRPTCCWRD